MNGFRRQLSGSVKELSETIKCVNSGDFYDTEDLIRLMN